MPQVRPIKRRKYEKFLKLVGCELQRTKGDHLIYSRPGLKRPVVITSDSEVPVFHIRTNLRTLGMTVEEYLNIIEKM